MTKNELKTMFLQMDYSNVKESKQIIVELSNNKFWPGYGDVEIKKEGPNGFSTFKTHQEFPLQYALDLMNKPFDGVTDYSEYELIIK